MAGRIILHSRPFGRIATFGDRISAPCPRHAVAPAPRRDRNALRGARPNVFLTGTPLVNLEPFVFSMRILTDPSSGTKTGTYVPIARPRVARFTRAIQQSASAVFHILNANTYLSKSHHGPKLLASQNNFAGKYTYLFRLPRILY
jgi:hypothetical protein